MKRGVRKGFDNEFMLFLLFWVSDNSFSRLCRNWQKRFVLSFSLQPSCQRKYSFILWSALCDYADNSLETHRCIQFQKKNLESRWLQGESGFKCLYCIISSDICLWVLLFFCRTWTATRTQRSIPNWREQRETTTKVASSSPNRIRRRLISRRTQENDRYFFDSSSYRLSDFHGIDSRPGLRRLLLQGVQVPASRLNQLSGPHQRKETYLSSLLVCYLF